MQTSAQSLAILTEANFQVAPPVSSGERLLNCYRLGLRRVVARIGRIVIGKAWSNSQHFTALPKTVDFFSLTDGTVPVRRILWCHSRPRGDRYTVYA